MTTTIIDWSPSVNSTNLINSTTAGDLVVPSGASGDATPDSVFTSPENVPENVPAGMLVLDLSQVDNRQLLVELFGRFKEAIFIGHADDRANPIQLACHLPQEATGMHSVLISALDRLLTGLRRKYPDAKPVETPAPVAG